MKNLTSLPCHVTKFSQTPLITQDVFAWQLSRSFCMLFVFAKVKGLPQMPELHDASLAAIMRRLQTMGCCSVAFVIMFCTVHLPSTTWAAKITINYVFPGGATSFLSSGQWSSIISRLFIKKSHETYSDHELKILQIAVPPSVTLLSVKLNKRSLEEKSLLCNSDSLQHFCVKTFVTYRSSLVLLGLQSS